MKNLLFLASFILALFLESCSENKDGGSEKKPEEARIENQDSINRVEIKASLCKKYGAAYWDMDLLLKMPYTFQYHAKLEKSNKIVLTDFYVYDIEKIDTSYSLTIKVRRFGGSIFLKMSCQLSHVNSIFPQTDSLSILTPLLHLDKVYLVMSVSSIRKASLFVGTTCADGNSSLEFQDNTVFFGKGTILDIVKKK
jgi:hypothetical protein